MNLQDHLNRRLFLQHSTQLGAAALASQLMGAGASSFPTYQPKAKRIIYLFQSGAPSQMDLFDPKPEMEKHRAEDLPASIRQGQRLTTMTSGQKTFPVAPSMFKFAQHGQSGMNFSELMPHMSKLADEWCMVRSMYTEAINHDPAITFFQTGSQLAGRPAIGSWVSYGLGSANKDLPGLNFKPWKKDGPCCYSVKIDDGNRAHLRNLGDGNWLAYAIGGHKELGHG